MKDLLIPILTFVFVVAVGGAVLVIRGARRRRLDERLYGGGGGSSGGAGHGGYMPPPLPGERRGLVGVAEQVGKAVTAGQPVATDLRSRLAQAGFYDEA